MNRQQDFFTLRLVAIDPNSSETLVWIGLDADGQTVASGRDLPEALPSSREVEIVLPANRVSAQNILLPHASTRYSQQILSQALEDKLLDKPENTHYVAGPRDGDHVQVWVVARDWLTNVLVSLATIDRTPARVLAEYEFLPASSVLVCAEADGYVFFRDPQGRHACIDSLATLAALYPDQPIDPLANWLQSAPQPGTNLLTGPFATKKSYNLDFASFKRSLWLCGALVLLLLILQVFEWQSLARREARLQQDIRQTFATLFPGTPIVDPILQWQSRQADNPNAVKDALNLAAQIAANMQISIRPRSLDVRDGVIRLLVSDADAAAARAALEKMGMVAESSTAEPGTVRLLVRAKR